MQGVVMGYMALAAAGSPARGIIAAMQGVSIGAADGLVRVTSGAEFVIAGEVYPGVDDGPASRYGNTQCRSEQAKFKQRFQHLLLLFIIIRWQAGLPATIALSLANRWLS
jgi:hypothetical protein